MRGVIAAIVGCVVGLSSACKQEETKHDLYMRGMAIEGEAERGECKLVYDSELQAHSLDGDKVQLCLAKIEEALALYEQAAQKGMDDVDFKHTYERAAQTRDKLQGMLKMVREMEQPEYKMELPRDP